MGKLSRVWILTGLAILATKFKCNIESDGGAANYSVLHRKGLEVGSEEVREAIECWGWEQGQAFRMLLQARGSKT